MSAPYSDHRESEPPPIADADALGRPVSPHTGARLIKVEEAVAATVMALIACITFANVVVRYLTDFSFAFTEEFSIALMVIVTLLGTSLAVAKNRHIRIEYFVDRLAPRNRRRVLAAALIPALVTMAALVVMGANAAYDEYRFEETSPGLGLPQWIYTIWLPLLSIAVLARVVGSLIRLWRVR